MHPSSLSGDTGGRWGLLESVLVVVTEQKAEKGPDRLSVNCRADPMTNTFTQTVISRGNLGRNCRKVGGKPPEGDPRKRGEHTREKQHNETVDWTLGENKHHHTKNREHLTAVMKVLECEE